MYSTFNFFKLEGKVLRFSANIMESSGRLIFPVSSLTIILDSGICWKKKMSKYICFFTCVWSWVTCSATFSRSLVCFCPASESSDCSCLYRCSLSSSSVLLLRSSPFNESTHADRLALSPSTFRSCFCSGGEGCKCDHHNKISQQIYCVFSEGSKNIKGKGGKCFY